MKNKWKEPSDVFWNEIVKEPFVNGFLDVGTGVTGVVGLHHVEKRVRGRKAAIDIFKVRDMPAGWEVHILDARKMLDFFGEKSFDVVQACDFIEHLAKEDGYKWLEDAEKVARKYVLIFTPKGFVPNPPGEKLYPDNPYQKHLSGWTPEEFEAVDFKTTMWGDKYIIAWKALQR